MVAFAEGISTAMLCLRMVELGRCMFDTGLGARCTVTVFCSDRDLKAWRMVEPC